MGSIKKNTQDARLNKSSSSYVHPQGCTNRNSVTNREEEKLLTSHQQQVPSLNMEQL